MSCHASIPVGPTSKLNLAPVLLPTSPSAQRTLTVPSYVLVGRSLALICLHSASISVMSGGSWRGRVGPWRVIWTLSGLGSC